jgi:hypothetical protein
MAGLKPIGSEKLEGMDKIRRIIEIARYNENIPQLTNESNSSEYKISLADGNSYEIVKERQGYIIKQSINESDADYIEPMQNRKYYSSYSQALKRLNLMTKEINTLYENEEGTSLFGEQKKKYVLKRPKSKVSTPAAEPDMGSEMPPAPDMNAEIPPVPGMGDEMPPIPDMGSEMPPMPDMGGEEEMPPMPDMGGEEEMPPMDDMGGEEEELEIDAEEKPREKKVSDLKRIQILVGKLSQKLRSYEEEKELSAQNVKYVINSILSAIDVDVLDEDDIEEIISKLEGGDEDDDESDDTSFEEEEDFSSEMEGEVPPPSAPGEEEPEMTETYDSYGEAVRDFIPAAYGNVTLRGMGGEQTESDMDGSDEYHKERRRGHRYPEVDSFEHGTFSESSVDKVLSKYFTLTEEEKVKKEKRTNENYRQNKQNIIKLSESTIQLDSALHFVKENPRVKLMGVSNKGNLIFKEGINEVKITREGDII